MNAGTDTASASRCIGSSEGKRLDERSAARARALFDSAPSAEAGARRTLARLQVQLALARGDLGRAHDALAEATDDGSRASLLQRAQVSLAEGSTAALRDASDALQVWVAEHRSDAGAWAQLALVANRQGQTLRAVRADAEAQAALGDLRGAIDRMRAGQLIAQRGGPYAAYPIFNIPPEVADAARNVGYNACTHATNHSWDQGADGIARLWDTLEANGIAQTGSYATTSPTGPSGSGERTERDAMSA